MKHIWKISFLLCFLMAQGCRPKATPPVAAIPGLPEKAQPKLPTIKLWIGAQEMNTEMAVTQIQEETGMMYRTNMGPNDGMIFVFSTPQRVSFWMMNTILPLSAAYIAPDGTILEIHDLQPHDTNSVVAQSPNIQYVLETPQGWFKSNNISTGTVIKTEKGSLHRVFFEN